MHFLVLLSFVGLALAAPVVEPGAVLAVRAAAPSVSIKNGTVLGSTSGGVDSFKGIPFAQPPVGNLRLRTPQTITKTFGTFDATKLPNSCPQMYFSVNTSSLPEEVIGYLLDTPLVQNITSQSEDCLNLNIFRPAGTTASSKLPVLFWIYGGGFELGSPVMYDGSNIVNMSADLNQPLMFVAVNYRVGAYGFMGGDDLTKEGNTNLGLRDQRKGLQWVQENIAAFGGDPSKVTIWGESAGAISVFDHLLINKGDNTYNGKPLFRGAIMNSGSAVPAEDTTSAKAQNTYNTVVAAGGCGSASDKLACLRALDYETFLNAANSNYGIFSYSSLDLAYLPRPDPNNNFFPLSPEAAAEGHIAKVPLIIGDQEDEGTLFSLVLGNVTTDDDLVTYFQSYFPQASRQQITDLVNLYPDAASAGSPFETGNDYEIAPLYKKIAAMLGDLTFTLTRRATLQKLDGQGFTKWSYLADFFQGLPVLGTFHASDILEIFFDTPFGGPASTFLTYYIAFANGLDPNDNNGAPVPYWPKWTNSSRALLEIGADGNGFLLDTFREAASDYLVANSSNFRV